MSLADFDDSDSSDDDVALQYGCSSDADDDEDDDVDDDFDNTASDYSDSDVSN